MQRNMALTKPIISTLALMQPTAATSSGMAKHI
jgi:hypothetical protein